jgi:hypothetical protein
MLAFALMLVVLQPAFAADTGSITGTVDRPADVKEIFALFRDDKPVKYPGKLDAKTGAFTVPGLPLVQPVDLLIDFGKGRLEGTNLRVKKTDYVGEEPPFTKDDEAKLKKTMTSLNKFEDVIEFLAINGNCQHAVVFVNKLRTQPFVNSNPGECIWRMELWFFEREELEDPWIKEQDVLFVVHYRERLQKADYDKKSVMMDPKLGGLEATAKEPVVKLGEVKLPDDKPGVRIRNAPVHPEKKED